MNLNKMISNTLKALLLAFFFLGGKQLLAQKVWTLQECIQYALSNSISLKQQELSVQTQQINLNQSKANLLPSINGSGSYGMNWGKSVDRFTNQFADSRTSSVNLYLQTEVTVFSGFRLLNTIRKNQLELLAGKYDIDNASQMKALEVTTAYLQILYAFESVKNKADQLKNTELQVDRIQKMVDAGSVSQGDLLNIKAQYSSENAQKIQAENSLNMAYLTLMQLMDLPSDTVFSIDHPIIELTPGFGKLLEARMVYDFAIQNRPEIKSAETKIETSNVDLSIAKSSFYPRISLSAGFGSGYSGANSVLDGNPTFGGFFPNGDITSAGDTVYSPLFNYKYSTKSFQDQITDNKNYSFGINVSVPIFNNFQTYNSVKLSKIAIHQAELNLEQQKNNLRKTIEQSYADASSAANTFKAAEIQVNARQETFNYATQKFEAGVMNAFEFNDAKIKLDAAKSDLLNAKYEYVFRVKVLDFYFGRPLNL